MERVPTEIEIAAAYKKAAFPKAGYKSWKAGYLDGFADGASYGWAEGYDEGRYDESANDDW